MDRTAEHNLSATHGDSEWIEEGRGCAICDFFHRSTRELEAEEAQDVS